MINVRARRILMSMIAALAFYKSPAFADDVASFYKGRNVDMVIGYGAGGGFDMWARAVSRHMGRKVPGAPTMVSRNMPAAGSLVAANYLYHVAAKDGSVIGLIGRGVMFEPLFDGAGAKFDPLRFTFIGNPSKDSYMCALWHTHASQTAADFYKNEMSLGSTGSGSESHVFPIVLANLLGMKAKVISGYKGSNEILLAIERRELDGLCLGTETVRRTQQYANGKYKILMQIGSKPDPILGNLPMISEFAKSADDRAVLELIFARIDVGRPFVGPPNVPKDRADALRSAFMQTMKDPEFKNDVGRMGLEIDASSGEELEALLRKAYQSDPEIVRRTAEMLKQ